jgi:hypothetical protein
MFFIIFDKSDDTVLISKKFWVPRVKQILKRKIPKQN